MSPMSPLMKQVADRWEHKLVFSFIQKHRNSVYRVYTCTNCGTRFFDFASDPCGWTATWEGVWQLCRNDSEMHYHDLWADFHWRHVDKPALGLAQSITDLVLCRDVVIKDIIQ